MMKIYSMKKQKSSTLLRKILCDNELEFNKDECGKPYIVNMNIHFNVTHTKHLSFVAISNKNIGIDAEDITDCDDAIAKHYFTKSEQAYISNYIDGSKSAAFFRIWTQKESYLKLIGKGFSVSPQSFSVIPTIDGELIFDYNNGCFFKTVVIDNICLTICY